VRLFLSDFARTKNISRQYITPKRQLQYTIPDRRVISYFDVCIINRERLGGTRSSVARRLRGASRDVTKRANDPFTAAPRDDGDVSPAPPTTECASGLDAASSQGHHSHTPPPVCAHIPAVYNNIRRVCTIIIIIYTRYRISRDPRSLGPPPAPPPTLYTMRRHEIPQVFPSLTQSLRNTRC